MDRYSYIEGIDNDFFMHFGSDVCMICEIMKVGECGQDYLSSEGEMTGEELIEFLREHNKTTDGVIPSGRYRLVAHDW